MYLSAEIGTIFSVKGIQGMVILNELLIKRMKATCNIYFGYIKVGQTISLLIVCLIV